MAEEKRDDEGAVAEAVLLVRVPVPVPVSATVAVAVLVRKLLGKRTPPVSVPDEPRVLVPCSLACCRQAVSHFLVAAMM